MSFLDLNELKKLSVSEQIKAKKDIINNNELATIPVIYLPEVFTTDYYFVSYSHKDYKEVYNDIFDLEQAGLSIWYDRGIPAGSNWKEVANKYIAPFSCKGTIFYISESALISEAIMSEIESALSFNKPFLVILISKNKESLRQLIERLYKENKIDENKYTYYLNVFKEEIIYLDINHPIQTKVEKIINCLPKQKKLVLSEIYATTCEEETKRPNGYFINIEALDDFYATNILVSDYLDLIDKDDLPRNTSAGLIRRPKELDFDHPIKDIDNIVSLEIYFGNSCFANVSSLEYVEYPNFHHRRVSKPPLINERAFYNCKNLKQFKFIHKEDIKMIKNVRIGKAAFARCSSLSSFDFERTILDDECFMHCYSLKEADLSKSFCKIISEKPYEVEIPYRAFTNCTSLETVYFPYLLVSIGERAFAETNLSSLEFPKSLRIIKEDAFAFCENLKTIRFNKGLEEIGEDAFYQTAVEKLNFPSSIKVIGNGAFYNCKNIKSIVLREGLEIIGISAFRGALIKAVALPSTLKAIGEYAFANCRNLQIIYFNNYKEQFEKMKRQFKLAFSFCHKDAVIIFKDKSTIKVKDIE